MLTMNSNEEIWKIDEQFPKTLVSLLRIFHKSFYEMRKYKNEGHLLFSPVLFLIELIPVHFTFNFLLKSFYACTLFSQNRATTYFPFGARLLPGSVRAPYFVSLPREENPARCWGSTKLANSHILFSTVWWIVYPIWICKNWTID